MAVLLRPKQWGQQAPQTAQVNWGHPLAQALEFAIVFASQNGGRASNLVQGWPANAFPVTNAQPSAYGPRGLHFDGTAGLTCGISSGTPDAPFLRPSGLTVMSAVTLDSQNGTNGHEFVAKLLASGSSLNPFDWRTDPNASPSLSAVRANAGFKSWTATSTIASMLGVSSVYGRPFVATVTYPSDQIDVAPTMYADMAISGVTGASTGTGAATGNSKPVFIGRRDDGIPSLIGSMKYAYIWSRPLSASEVRWLVAEPYAMLQSQAPRQRYWSVPTLRLGTTRRKKPWGVQKPPVAAQIDWDHSLAQGLVGAWLFNEEGGAKVQNLAGPLQGSLLNTYAWSPEGVEMSNDNSAINRTNLGDIRITGDMTVLCSYTPLRLNGAADVGVIDKWDSGARPANCEWTLGQSFFAASADGRQHFGVAVGALTAYAAAPSGDAIVPGTRYALAGTRRGTTLTLYRNGKVINTAAGPSGALNTGTGRVVKIGEIDNGAGNNTNARFHYAYLWNRALSQDEIQRLYAEPFALIRPVSRLLPTSTPDLSAAFARKPGAWQSAVPQIRQAGGWVSKPTKVRKSDGTWKSL